LALLISTGVSAIALAQDQAPAAGDIALARSLGLEGVQLADAGNCAAAIDKLQRAEALYHAPTMLGRLGECQVRVGKIVAGTETLQRVVREPLQPKAPKAFVDAQARAQKVLDAALPKLAKLKIHVEAPPGVRPVVKLDGEPVSSASLDVDRPADPGSHQIEASAPGFKTAKTDAILQEGGSGMATLRLEADWNAGPPPPGTPPYASSPPGAQGPPGPQGPPPQGYEAPPMSGPPPAAAGDRPESKGSSKTLGFVLIGVGGAGIALGSIFGALALGRRSTLDGACNPKSNCPLESQPDIDSLHTFATVSTVGFAVGGVGLATGLIVLVTSKSQAGAEVKSASSAPSARGERDRPLTGLSVTPFVGPRSFGFEGSF
jgi:hypothetical protein